MYSEKIPIKNYFLEVDKDIFNCLVSHEVKFINNYEKRFLSEYYLNTRIIAKKHLSELLGIEINNSGAYYYNYIFYMMQGSIRKLANYVLKNNQTILYAIDKFNYLKKYNISTLRHYSTFKIKCNNFLLSISLNTKLICNKIPVIDINWFPNEMIKDFYKEYEEYLIFLRRISILYNILSKSYIKRDFISMLPELKDWVVGDINDVVRYVNPYYLIDITKSDYLDKYTDLNCEEYLIKFPYKIYLKKEEIRLGKLNSSNYFFQL